MACWRGKDCQICKELSVEDLKLERDRAKYLESLRLMHVAENIRHEGEKK